ncbi:MAG TPA: DEAD/DEAH box helicase family protein [Candidatus Saccharimonadales bacterium]|nr:DEAD/DEAH box helicase family protein [Candidatus Saccharimonadales bacterium]
MEQAARSPEQTMPPRHIDAAEQVLQMPLFQDEVRSETLYDGNMQALDAADIESRKPVYMQMLRILARKRWAAREPEIAPVRDAARAEKRPINFDAKGWNERWENRLTRSYCAEITQEQQTQVEDVRATLEKIYDAEESEPDFIEVDPSELEDELEIPPPGNEPETLPEEEREATETPDHEKPAESRPHTSMQYVTADTKKKADELFPLQHDYVDDMLEKLNLPHAVVERGGVKYHVRGVLGVGPTGFGKTAVLGEIAKRKAIGTILPNGLMKRMLIIVPSTADADQFAGILGDKTFQRFSGNIPVSAFHSMSKQTGGAVIATTKEQFVIGFKNGHFFGIPIHFLAFDEAHHITEPLVEETFLHEWRGETVGVTATPDYDKIKDARNVLPHVVSHIDFLGSIDEKITNGAQLFTFVVDCREPGDEDRPVKELRQLYRVRRDEVIAEFLSPLLLEGRRSMSFCDAGMRNQYAVDMATRLSEITSSDGRTVRAAALTSYAAEPDDKPERIIEQYHARKIDALTAVLIGSENFNADIDVITLNEGVSSRLLRQRTGRGARRSEKYPVTIYAQFFIAPEVLERRRGPRAILYEALGLERIKQGVIIASGSKPREYNKQTDRESGAVDPLIFSERIQHYIRKVNYRTVGQILLDADRPQEVPEGYVRFDTIPRPKYITPAVAHERLEAEFEWIGTRARGGSMVRWYEPDARYFFSGDSEGPPENTSGALSLNKLASLYNIDLRTTRDVVNNHQVPTTPLISNGKKSDHILIEDLPLFEAGLEEDIPLQQKDDIALSELAEELVITYGHLYGMASRENILAGPRRLLAPIGSRTKIRSLLTKKDADVIRKKINAHPRGEKGTTTRADLMARLDITDPHALTRQLTKEEVSWLTPRWTIRNDNKFVLLSTWTKEQGDLIENRLRTTFFPALPIHVVPRIAAERVVDRELNAITPWLRRRPELEGLIEQHTLPGNTKKRKCYPWPVLRGIVEGYHDSVRPDAPAIDFDKLPSSADDNDPERVAYARYIQAKITPSELLGFDPTPYIAQFES